MNRAVVFWDSSWPSSATVEAALKRMFIIAPELTRDHYDDSNHLRLAIFRKSLLDIFCEDLAKQGVAVRPGIPPDDDWPLTGEPFGGLWRVSGSYTFFMGAPSETFSSYVVV